MTSPDTTSTTITTVVEPPAALAVYTPNVSGARTDAQLFEVWLSTKTSVHTRRAYASDAARFVAYLEGTPLPSVTVRDFQGFVDSLTGATSSRARTIGSVKALLAFGARRDTCASTWGAS